MSVFVDPKDCREAKDRLAAALFELKQISDVLERGELASEELQAAQERTYDGEGEVSKLSMWIVRNCDLERHGALSPQAAVQASVPRKEGR